MFFTEEVIYGTSHMSADSLFGGWDIANRTIVDAGHAPEITVLTDGSDMFSRYSVHNDGQGGDLVYVIRFDTLTWTNDVPYVSKPWALGENWVNVEGLAFKWQPTFHNNAAARGEAVEDTHVGHFWVGTKEFYLGPLGGGYPGGQVGDAWLGLMRSKPFVMTGNSINLLVGGTNAPGLCVVRLVLEGTGEVLYEETGKGVEEMDRRYWHTHPYDGMTAYIEVQDSSTTGHINVDDIIESYEFIENQTHGTGTGVDKRGFDNELLRIDREPRLGQNSPNPFNPSTSISFQVPSPSAVRIEVYDVAGALVRRLFSRELDAGSHRAEWDGRRDDGTRSSSGVYFYRLIVDDRVVQTRRMVLIK